MPTLAESAPRYIEGYSRANREKHSTTKSKQCHLSVHLLPMFGDRRLDELHQEDIQRLKGALADPSARMGSDRPNFLYRDEGTTLTVMVARRWLKKTLELANLRDRGPHTLRHSFCSHLAMRGAPARAISQSLEI